MTDAPKFTPGPWSVDDGDGSYYGIFDESGDPIAYLAEPTPSGAARLLPGLHPYADRDNYPFAETHVANARLLAASPEMYDALKNITDCYGVGSTPEKFVEHVHDFMLAGRAALAKARNETA